MSSMHELPPLGLAPAADPVAPVEQLRPLLRVVPDVPLDFDDAVRRLSPRLQRYATRRLGDAHEAEELVQEALLRAYKNRGELLTEDDVAAWTTVVVGRLVIDRLRAAAGRVAAPAAIGMLSLGVIGGALGTSPWRGGSHAPVVVHTVAGAQATPTRIVPVPAAAAPAARVHVVSPARPAAAAPHAARVHTLAEDAVHLPCAGNRQAGAGNETCAGSDPAASVYLTPSLPDNPTGVRELGVKTDAVDCRQLPAIPLTRCTTPSTGGTR